MSVVTAATLAARLGVSVSAKITGAVEAGEAAVCDYLGCESLALTIRNERVRIPRDRVTLPLTLGPLTSLTSMTVDDEAVTLSEILARYWWLERDDLSTFFPGNKDIRLVYVAGWIDEASLPAPIREAVLQTGGQTYDMSAGGMVKTSESLADWSVSYSQLAQATVSTTSLPPGAKALLGRFRRPQV